MWRKSYFSFYLHKKSQFFKNHLIESILSPTDLQCPLCLILHFCVCELISGYFCPITHMPSSSHLDSDIPCQALLTSWASDRRYHTICHFIWAPPYFALDLRAQTSLHDPLTQLVLLHLTPGLLTACLDLSPSPRLSPIVFFTPSGPGTQVRLVPHVTHILTGLQLWPWSWVISLCNCVPYSLFRIKTTELNSYWAQMIEFKEQSKNNGDQKYPAIL